MPSTFSSSPRNLKVGLGRRFDGRGWDLVAMLVILACALLCLLLPASGNDDFQRRCLSLAPERFVSNSTRTVLEYVPAGTNLTFPDNDPTCARPSQVVSADLCRIALSIPTTNRSSITFEAWFPRDWSGRFLGTGNGGVDGCIKYEDLAYTSQHGFAAIGTNDGHNGTTGITFYRNPDIVTDFAWRSLHTGVVVGKRLVKQFYQKPQKKSYYLGCSLGGRQGIKSAEKFPDDFDGIVVGAPAVDFNNLCSWRASFYPITGPIGSANFIPSTAWKTWIHDEVLRQCDSIDGVTDGIIEDPTLCHFNPAKLLCTSNANSTNCLNAAQVEIVRKIFSPFTYPDGSLIYPAMQPGSEINAVDKLYAGKPFSYSDDWFKYAIYENPNWNASTFTYRDAAFAEALNPSDIRTYPSSLTPFQRRGGKILVHHGQQDNQITSFNTPRFYQHLLSGTRSTPKQLDQWFRFFRISGMFHCNTGPGAWVIGQGGGPSATGPWEAESNVLKAMVDWIEEGEAPETIEGTKYVNDTVALGVAIKRKHCKYPARNKFIGGDASSPKSWKCV